MVAVVNHRHGSPGLDADPAQAPRRPRGGGRGLQALRRADGQRDVRRHEPGRQGGPDGQRARRRLDPVREHRRARGARRVRAVGQPVRHPGAGRLDPRRADDAVEERARRLRGPASRSSPRATPATGSTSSSRTSAARARRPGRRRGRVARFGRQVLPPRGASALAARGSRNKPLLQTRGVSRDPRVCAVEDNTLRATDRGVLCFPRGCRRPSRAYWIRGPVVRRQHRDLPVPRAAVARLSCSSQLTAFGSQPIVHMAHSASWPGFSQNSLDRISTAVGAWPGGDHRHRQERRERRHGRTSRPN